MSSIRVWTTATDERLPRGAKPGADRISLAAPRGGIVSCRVVVQNPRGSEPIRIDVDSGGIAEVQPRVRRVGYVPLPHYNTRTPACERHEFGPTPTLVPDPLYDETETVLGCGETVIYWIRFDVHADAKPGTVRIPVRVFAEAFDGGSHRRNIRFETPERELAVDVRIHRPRIADPSSLEVTHWFYADTILDWYGFDTFDEGYWGMVPAYMRDLADHGVNVLYTPVFTAQTDGLRRPSQLLHIRTDGDRYRFDFRDVDRYIDLGKQAGFTRFEFPHLFSQWGARRAARVYRGQGADERPLFDPSTEALDPVYRRFLEVLLPKLETYLDSKRLTDRVWFHVSDEPHGDEDRAHYRAARNLLAELAPWMRTTDAVSEIAYGSDGLTDVPIPVTSAVDEYIARGIRCGTYYCCGPRDRYINRFLDTPLTEIRALGWALYRYRALVGSFLHWGYNYWYLSQTRELIDPYTETDGGRWPGWAYGDPFVVYPGLEGPVDSIRWEAFAEGLSDYRLLEASGVEPDAGLLAAIRGFDDFPREPGWYASARGEVLAERRGASARGAL